MPPVSYAADFDRELIARYQGPAPRYTSYPTAPHFTSEFDQSHFQTMARASNCCDVPRPLSLYVHIPFCWSPCFYCGCNRIITHNKGQSGEYLSYLDKEMGMIAPLFDADRPVRQLHLGGGTPNFLQVEQLGELMRMMQSHFHFPDDAKGVEAGIEVDPRFADYDYVCRLGEVGFNRVSIGLQDFNPAVQKAVNRIQSVEETEAVIKAARASHFQSVNIDLIYGLPKQTLEGFARTLDTVIDLAPDRLAVYGYAHLPHLFKAQTQLKAEDLPDGKTRLELLGLAVEKLEKAGYLYVGMDHFARPDDELVNAQREGSLQRNFQGYSTWGDCDIVGLGMSAIGRIGNSYTQNARDLAGYYLDLSHGKQPLIRGKVLTDDDLIRRAAINELMCHGGLDIPRFGHEHRIAFTHYFSSELAAMQPLADDGLVVLHPDSIEVTPRGRFLIRNVAMVFDAYLDNNATISTPRYSRSI